MIYRILADGIVLVHFLWILFLIFGVFWGVRNKTVKVLHVAGLFGAFLVQVGNWYCPLTHIEVWLRSMHNPAMTYTGSFITRYAEKAVYSELPHAVIVVLTILLCSINGWAYFIKHR